MSQVDLLLGHGIVCRDRGLRWNGFKQRRQIGPLRGRAFNEEEVEQMVAFLKSLTGEFAVIPHPTLPR